MKRGEPFSGDFPGTTEEYVIRHAHCLTKLFFVLLFGWAACGPLACGHAEPYMEASQHDAAGCLTVCPSATYVELSPKGDLCRCWAPNAFTYTFLYPSDQKLLEEQRDRWLSGKKAVEACVAKGQAWEPSEDHRNIVCMQPSEPEPDPIDPLKHASLSPTGRGIPPVGQPRPSFASWPRKSVGGNGALTLSGRNRPPPKWLLLTPWESWRPRVWRRSA